MKEKHEGTWLIGLIMFGAGSALCKGIWLRRWTRDKIQPMYHLPSCALWHGSTSTERKGQIFLICTRAPSRLISALLIKTEWEEGKHGHAHWILQSELWAALDTARRYNWFLLFMESIFENLPIYWNLLVTPKSILATLSWSLADIEHNGEKS